jgi:hypothetical protein
MSEIDKFKILFTHRMQSMKDEAAVRKRFTLKQQVEELQHLYRRIEEHYERLDDTKPKTNGRTESIGANGNTV